MDMMAGPGEILRGSRSGGQSGRAGDGNYHAQPARRGRLDRRDFLAGPTCLPPAAIPCSSPITSNITAWPAIWPAAPGSGSASLWALPVSELFDEKYYAELPGYILNLRPAI